MGDVMKKIQLSLEQICYASKEFRWKSGGEGFIIRIPYKESYIILKIFYNDCTFHLSKSILKQKENKLCKIKQRKIENNIQPLMIATLEEETIGYFMTYAKNFLTLDSLKGNREYYIRILRQIQKRIRQFHQKNIFLGDIKENNILVQANNPNIICFCDLDNMAVDDIPFDITNYYTDSFLFQYGEIDEKVDWYTFNLMTLQILYQLKDYEEALAYVTRYRGNCRAIWDMQRISENYEGKILLEEREFYQEAKVPYILRKT